MDLAHISFSGIDAPRPRPAAYRPAHTSRSSGRDVDDQASAVPIDPIASWILLHSGVDPAAYRSESVHRRLSACLRSLQVSSFRAAFDVMIREPKAIAQALDALLIGSSGFFRDAHVFSALQHHVLPRLIGRRKRVRVLSAGCSSGEELYSVAILLHAAGVLESSELMGIDCRSGAIDHAKAGHYSEQASAGLTQAQKESYFVRDPKGWTAAEWLRNRITWRCENLLEFRDEQPWDLILFRNVAIYLASETAANVWASFAKQIGTGGYLVSGSAEHPPKSLPLLRVAPSIYRRN